MKSLDFPPIFLLIEFGQIKQKLKMGHVQDTPVSTSMISNVCMICHIKAHIVSYNLDQKKFSKSKIHTLPDYEQTVLKTAIVIRKELSEKKPH